MAVTDAVTLQRLRREENEAETAMPAGGKRRKDTERFSHSMKLLSKRLMFLLPSLRPCASKS